MRIAVAIFLGMFACSAPLDEHNDDLIASESKDSALYFFNRIDSGIATFNELEVAKIFY